jgi:hypothetical protein
MLTLDAPILADPRWLFFCDRLDLLREIQSIDFALAMLEVQHGADAGLAELRDRLYVARGIVLSQLRELVATGAATAATVH